MFKLLMMQWQREQAPKGPRPKPRKSPSAPRRATVRQHLAKIRELRYE